MNRLLPNFALYLFSVLCVLCVSVVNSSAQNARLAGVTGQVVDKQGKPLAGVPVEYEEVPGTNQFNGPTRRFHAARTDKSGRFTVAKLSPNARYRFSFGGSYWTGSTQWGNTTYPPHPNTVDDYLRLPYGETVSIGQVVVYRANKTFSLIARAANNKPVRGLTVTLSGDHTLVYGTTNAQGRFFAPHVVNEPLTLDVYSAIRTGYSRDPSDDDRVFSGPVRAGQTNLPILVRTAKRRP